LPNLLTRLFGRNKFRQAFFAYLFPGTNLAKDDLDSNIQIGYEENPTIFGASNKLATKAADVPIVAMRGEKESDVDPLKELFTDKTTDYSLKEYRTHWHLFRLLLGENIT